MHSRYNSIVAWNHPIPYPGRNLKSQLLENTACNSSNPKDTAKDDNLLKVYLRIKKCECFEELYDIVDDNALLCKVPEGAQCIRNIGGDNTVTKTFKFSKIFGPQSIQTDLFNGFVKEKVLLFINGHNCSLLTYGASGSGKTFTIVGTADKPGMIPRALEYLFRSLPQLPEQPNIKPTAFGGIVRLSKVDCKRERIIRRGLLKGSQVNIDYAQHTRTYRAMQERLGEEPVALIEDDISGVSLSVWVSFAEIYNEHVYDLLKPEPSRGQQRQKLRIGYCNGNAYIKDLTCISVSSGLEAYYILQCGLHNLKYAATSLNDHSSRSHSIFTIKLCQASDTQEGVSVSCFNFCDLAGSERVKKTHNVGDRLKESNNINTSLLVLGRCVSLIRESQKQNDNTRIPFRESKLTQLFQQALLGREAISMIVNINPTRDMFDECQHVLNFSAIAKDVVIERQLIKYPKNNRFSQYLENRNTICTIDESELQELQEQVEYLFGELQHQKLDAADEKQHVIKTYKEILANERKCAENQYNELEDRLRKRAETAERRCFELESILQEAGQEPTKRRKVSIVVIESSSEEEEEENAEDNIRSAIKEECKENMCDLNIELIQLKRELTQVKLEPESKDVKHQKIKEECVSLRATLEDAQEAYVELQLKFENVINELNLEIIKNEELVNEFNIYKDAYHKTITCDVDEDKENDAHNYNNESFTINSEEKIFGILM